MSTPLATGRHGLTPFRLTDIPLAVRRSAAARLIRDITDDADLLARVMIERAVETPSDRVYWVPKEAFDNARRARVRWR